MSENMVENYGWETTEGPHSCNYIIPEILKIIDDLKIRRVLDLGSGNGKLCFELKNAGYNVVGIEYDKQGVKVSKTNYPEIEFYNFGVQDDPKDLLLNEEIFDGIVSTEVICKS